MCNDYNIPEADVPEIADADDSEETKLTENAARCSRKNTPIKLGNYDESA